MNTYGPISPARKAALNGLATVGFVALVAGGMWLAVYSGRFVPTIADSAGAALASLGSLFSRDGGPSLSVVPTASTTIPFGDASSTPPVSTPGATGIPTTSEGTETTSHYPGSATSTPAVPHGLPDLTVTIIGAGYATSTDFGGFVASTTIAKTATGAVKFRIENRGTNSTGAWDFSVSLPTNPVTIRTFPTQASLNPGDSVVFVLDFNQLAPGTGMISVSADPEHAVTEVSEDNNGASATLTILNS